MSLRIRVRNYSFIIFCGSLVAMIPLLYVYGDTPTYKLSQTVNVVFGTLIVILLVSLLVSFLALTAPILGLDGVWFRAFAGGALPSLCGVLAAFGVVVVCLGVGLDATLGVPVAAVVGLGTWVAVRAVLAKRGW